MGIGVSEMFYGVIVFVIIQRVVELFIAKRNEKWIKNKGGIELGQRHYNLIVAIHILFLVSLVSEVFLLKKELISFWQILVILFVFTQGLRIWAITSLGRFWNTKILVLPNATIKSKGPYQFLRHPNYVVVALEILILPLLFSAWATAIVFTIVNALILAVRIPEEEKALMAHTNYKDVFATKSRFHPST
jgi:methyltransferase